MVGKKEVLCTIVDSDKIILDVFGDKKEKISIDLDSLRETIESDKTVFFADDSSLVRNLIHKTCTKLGVKHQIYDNGKKLLYELHKTDKDEIGLIVTDIEMPVMNGLEALKKIVLSDSGRDMGEMLDRAYEVGHMTAEQLGVKENDIEQARIRKIKELIEA